MELLAFTRHGEELIQEAGLVCRRANERKKAGSTAKFVQSLIDWAHGSVLEHATGLWLSNEDPSEILDLLIEDEFFRVTRADDFYYISGNPRSILSAEHFLASEMEDSLADLAPALFARENRIGDPGWKPIETEGNIALWSIFAPEIPTEHLYKHGRATLFLRDVTRSLTHQLVRHRQTFSQASQRHCGEENFGYEVPPTIAGDDVSLAIYEDTIEDIRGGYKSLVDRGIPKEDARYLLPNACYSEIVVTMHPKAWQNFFNLRCDHHAQWEIRQMAAHAREMLLSYDSIRGALEWNT